MKKTTIILSFICLLLIISCENNSTKVIPSQIASQVEKFEYKDILSKNNIKTQEFLISTEHDTTITGLSGSILLIKKNSFIDSNDNVITGLVKIKVKECLTKLDMVLGNMTTLSDGKLLESGGMIYINASYNDINIKLSTNSQVDIIIPTENPLDNMSVFEGTNSKTEINWINPVKLKPIKIEKPEIVNLEIIEVGEDVIKKTNVAYSIKGFHYGVKQTELDGIPAELTQKLNKLVWDKDGLILSKDSIIMVDTFEVKLTKLENIREFNMGPIKSNVKAVKGTNQFREDLTNNYIFSVKKLGWANIDRLYNDPRSKEIELIVKVNQFEDYEQIYTSMIFKNQNMYLPGYQKEDKTFSFTHGDHEETILPIGETVTILITAYKNERPSFVINTFVIQDTQTINLTLHEITQDDLRKELEERI